MSEISDRYHPQEVENKIYQFWEKNGYFKAKDQSTQVPFCVILPPPNVTGFLHMGHALNHSIQDCIVRWKRMRGYNTLWLPGTDHAGIATQTVVERELKKENLTRQKLGREQFLEKVWQWKNQYGDRIYSQMRFLGDSCDWERAVFTLDEGASKAVRKVFVSLYKKGLIYRGKRLVNWSGPLETAISDLEVEYQSVKGTLWHIRYPLEDGSGYLVVATTRPETLLGDSAVCVHPDDERYQSIVGKKVLLPLLKRPIPIIADNYVDRQFGSGVVKITPAHDFNDYKIGKNHQLPMINILTQQCLLNENTGPYQGLKAQEARKRVLVDLKAQNLIEKEEPHTHNIGHCSRSGAVVEPYLSEQWFVKMEPLATPAKRVVENGTVSIEPESWTKVYLHWLNIIEDWCISRQLWWGHRIPAWHCKDCLHTTVSESDPSQCESCKSTQIHQDEDVLDTWFSSALWPFSTLGWPKETESLKTFYPTDLLVTGPDILFFWVARMIMMGLEFNGDVPFRKVYLHGIVRDSQGRKMSKSLGNSIDPVVAIQQYGADALRFNFLAHIYSGKDFKFSEQRIEGYRNFMNKIWNATRYSLNSLVGWNKAESLPNKNHLSTFDQWIINKLSQLEKNMNVSLEQYRLSDAASSLYHFVWNDFCDWYIEFTKPIFKEATAEEKSATQFVLANTLNRVMRLMHPFAPFITEELYQKLPIHGSSCMMDQYPTSQNDQELLSLGNSNAEKEIDLIKEVITAVRNIKGENRINPSAAVKVRLAPNSAEGQKILGNHRKTIMTLARITQLDIGEEGNLRLCALTPVQVENNHVKVIVPLEGLVDIEEEIKRIHKAIEKLQKDISGLNSRLNNPNFVSQAATDIVESDRQLLATSLAKLESLQATLLRLN